MSKPIKCPHCHEKVVLHPLAHGYATHKWGGKMKETPYLRCPKCTATFPEWGIEAYLAR